MAGRVYLAGPPFADEYRRRAVALIREAGLEPVDPMRRDFRGNTTGRDTEIVEGDLDDIRGCDAVLAAFTAPDEGTAMETWYAHSLGKPVLAYTGGSPLHPWAAHVSVGTAADLGDAIGMLVETLGRSGPVVEGDVTAADRDRVVLAIDVGGSHVKLLLSTSADERRRFASGSELGPEQLLAGVEAETRDWSFDVVSIGIPAPVRDGRVVAEPVNLGPGWVGFDFQKAFGKPTKVVNDAAMQALGSYDGGKMLFLGLGTGLGSTLVVDQVVVPMELGHLPFREATFEDYVGERGLEKQGKKKWLSAVDETIERLTAAVEPDYVVLGGGNAKKLAELPPNARLGANTNAFVGAFRLWDPAMPELVAQSH
jgi:polyphosphate glucokinase